MRKRNEGEGGRRQECRDDRGRRKEKEVIVPSYKLKSWAPDTPLRQGRCTVGRGA